MKTRANIGRRRNASPTANSAIVATATSSEARLMGLSHLKLYAPVHCEPQLTINRLHVTFACGLPQKRCKIRKLREELFTTTIINVMPEATIQQLFTETLRGDYEDEAPWEAVRKLRQLGTREVFDVAAAWCSSDNPLKRARGIDVLAQLGKTAEHRTNSFPDESYSVVTNLLKGETDVRPLTSAIFALGHLDEPGAVPLIAQFRSHPNAETRFAVACALGSFPNEPLSVETLLALMADADEDVRDWATFGLGNQVIAILS